MKARMTTNQEASKGATQRRLHCLNLGRNKKSKVQIS